MCTEKDITHIDNFENDYNAPECALSNVNKVEGKLTAPRKDYFDNEYALINIVCMSTEVQDIWLKSSPNSLTRQVLVQITMKQDSCLC